MFLSGLEVKLIIEITTYYNEYSSFVWDNETKDRADDELKELVQRFIEEEDERDTIAYEIMSDWKNSGLMLPGPYFDSIDVSYPDGEFPNEYIRPEEEIENNHKNSIEDYYQKELNGRHKVVILQDSQMKRGCWKAEIETDKPFNINFLSITDETITYGFHEIEYDEGGEGNYTDNFWEVR